MSKYIDADRLKEEIKKKIAEIESEPAPADRETLLLQMCKVNSFREVLSVMNRLQQEQPMKGYDENYLNEKIAKAKKSWEGVDVDKYMDEVRGREQEQPHFADASKMEQPKVDLGNYISNKLRELGADLINHKPYSFNRGLNVGKTSAYDDILTKINARREDEK